MEDLLNPDEHGANLITGKYKLPKNKTMPVDRDKGEGLGQALGGDSTR